LLQHELQHLVVRPAPERTLHELARLVVLPGVQQCAADASDHVEHVAVLADELAARLLHRPS